MTTVELATTVIEHVSDISTPHVKPIDILFGDPKKDSYHIARLRGVVAIILKYNNVHVNIISKIFKQSFSTTYQNIRQVQKVRHSKRYYKHFLKANNFNDIYEYNREQHHTRVA